MIKLGLCVIAACGCGLIVFFPRRTIYVNGLISLIFAGSVLSMILQIELWPFSPYPMFANVQGPILKRVRLYGVPVQVGKEEIPLVWELAAPFGEPDVADVFQQLRKTGDESQLQRAVVDCLVRYERRREAGLIDSPRLRGIRLYAVEWQLDAEASTKQRPSKQELIVQINF